MGEQERERESEKGKEVQGVGESHSERIERRKYSGGTYEQANW